MPGKPSTGGVDLPDDAVVVAARGGDARALEELVGAYLPLVYNIVGRAMDGHPDVDDVVQTTMLRVVNHLAKLDEPGSFRAWLVAIAVRQVRTWGEARRRRPAPLPPEELAFAQDPGTDFADLAVLRLELTGQRREAAEVARWLEEEEREILSLWWLETAGRLTRAEWTRACEISSPYAAVRVTRIRERLEAARAVLRALGASPRCSGLDGLLSGWDGRPGPSWRRRLHRHVRDCPRCEQASAGLVPADRLLGGIALVPLPVGLAPHVLGSLTPTAASPATATSSTGPDPAPGHPRTGRSTGGASRPTLGAASAVVAGAAALLIGTTVWHTLREEEPPPPAVTVAPRTEPAQPPPLSTAPARTPAPSGSPSRAQPSPETTLGDHALEFASRPGQYLAAYSGKIGIAVRASSDSPAQVRRAATFTVVPGLADRTCYSLRDDDGQYLRHNNFRLRLAPDDSSPLFAQDATFCLRPDPQGSAFALRSLNFPDRYVHYRDGQFFLDPAQDTGAYWEDSSFRFTAPLE